MSTLTLHHAGKAVAVQPTIKVLAYEMVVALNGLGRNPMCPYRQYLVYKDFTILHSRESPHRHRLLPRLPPSQPRNSFGIPYLSFCF